MTKTKECYDALVGRLAEGNISQAWENLKFLCKTGTVNTDPAVRAQIREEMRGAGVLDSLKSLDENRPLLDRIHADINYNTLVCRLRQELGEKAPEEYVLAVARFMCLRYPTYVTQDTEYQREKLRQELAFLN
jgi:hypothetical protein